MDSAPTDNGPSLGTTVVTPRTESSSVLIDYLGHRVARRHASRMVTFLGSVSPVRVDRLKRRGSASRRQSLKVLVQTSFPRLLPSEHRVSLHLSPHSVDPEEIGQQVPVQDVVLDQRPHSFAEMQNLT